MDNQIAVAIDGPVGAGKSTVAKLIAKKLGIIYVDTGAMYRSVGLYAVRKGIETTDAEKLREIIDEINLDVEIINGVQNIFMNGENVSDLIRTPEISMAASNVSAVVEVRNKLVDIQRNLSKSKSVIMDGRDIGTVVLPNADTKIYLTASPEERAERRFKELKNKGSNVTYQEVYDDLVLRDRNDSTRAASPLKAADDAIILDTTGMSLDEVVNESIKLINKEV